VLLALSGCLFDWNPGPDPADSKDSADSVGSAGVLFAPTVDFGDVPMGCEPESTAVLRNDGDARLVVERVFLADDTTALSLDLGTETQGSLPWALGTGVTRTVLVRWVVGVDLTSTLHVETDAGITGVDVFGTVAEADARVEEFKQPSAEPTDVLIALSRSTGTQSRDDHIFDGLATFVERSLAVNDQVRFSLVTRDDGCVAGTWVEGVPHEEATQALLGLVETGGEDTDKAFTLFLRALEAVDVGECNEGLVRDGAPIDLIAISGEREGSGGDHTGWLEAISLHHPDFVVHGIGGDYPQGCLDFPPYSGIYEATAATGGLMVSICSEDDWGQWMDVVEGPALESRFLLEMTPVDGTVSVMVDGQIVEDWSVQSGSVVFDEASIPPAGASIQVSYDAVQACP
jgi:hypothetical protein